jgi:hypothetical protein
MRTRKVFVLSLLSGAAVLFSGCPAQPPGPCVVARATGGAAEGIGSPYVVKYFLKTSTGDCTTNPNIAPYATTNGNGGDFVGALWAEAYGPVTAVDKITGLVPEEFGWTNGYTGDYVAGGPNTGGPDNPVILGNFTTDLEDANNTCTIMGTSPGVQVINGVTVSYNYTSTLVYTNAAAGEGAQIQADVTITRTDGATTCTNTYTGIGLWPTAVCNVANDCNPQAQPALNRALGSGLLTGIPLVCDTTLVAEDPIVAPNNIPQVPDLVCTLNGEGDDTCASDPAANPGTVCSNLVSTGGATACTVGADGTDPCATDDTSTETCIACDASGCAPAGAGNSGTCGTQTGDCAVPYLDAYGCGDGVKGDGQPYIILTGGCGGGAHDNNGTGGTNLCFYTGASPTAFPYVGNFTD